MPTHAEQRVLVYQPRQLFDLVKDIERYPEFLPWCVAVRVRRREPGRVMADVLVGFRMIRERFTSEATFREPPEAEELRIDVRYLEGPFRYLNNHWRFLPHEKGCLIDFFIDFEFHSRLMQKILQPLFNEAVRRMVGAFEARARSLYG